MTIDNQKDRANKENKERLNDLYKKYNLTPADVFTHKHYDIITRTGFDKILSSEPGISYSYSVKCAEKDCVIIQGVFSKGEKRVETLGSAHSDNCTSSYYAEMAEKRCKARGVLMLLGFYENNVYSEDEMNFDNEREKEEFNKSKKYSSQKRGAEYKGV